VIWTDTSGETSVGTLQARETVEQPCRDVLAHTPEVCKGARLYNGYLARKNDHDLWGTCTTSVECKTVIIVVLTVMNGTDPHMISGNLVRFGLVALVQLARSILCGGLYGVIDVSLLRYWSFA
jgi:hypothetical protein